MIIICCLKVLSFQPSRDAIPCFREIIWVASREFAVDWPTDQTFYHPREWCEREGWGERGQTRREEGGREGNGNLTGASSSCLSVCRQDWLRSSRKGKCANTKQANLLKYRMRIKSSKIIFFYNVALMMWVASRSPKSLGLKRDFLAKVAETFAAGRQAKRDPLPSSLSIPLSLSLLLPSSVIEYPFPSSAEVPPSLTKSDCCKHFLNVN